ncbi:MAG: tRNA (adenosine(37)-N6)-threonylcarbamoyltransferase complex transferase subunit TsaD [Clostridia bacterium]|nr:tRNA (adenosine(37)-N6)-threonylcarbamoyltransferase complex transferase subunit TsaD [Clostridia bacterium]
MLILGIESSCDETAAAIVEDGRKVHSSVVATQIERHKLFGGVVPEIASRMHAESITSVVNEAIDKAGCTLSDIDAIAVTAAPGLIGSLLVGVSFAKGLSFSAGVPLVPVHHLRGHIAANYIAHDALKPPFLCLVVSGGHSHIVEVRDYTDMRVIGRTRDDAAGEAFDKTARALGLPYPGGVHLDKIADGGNASCYQFPKPKIDGSPYDFSFSGLKTAVINMIHNMKQKGEEPPVADIAASVRKCVADILTERFMHAARDLGYSRLALAGGVSANSELRRRMTELCEKSGAELYIPPLSLCGDNAAMIAAQGYYEFISGNVASLDLNAAPSMEIGASF